MKAYAVDPGNQHSSELEDTMGKTTAPTVRAAIVNWLIAFEGLYVSPIHSDEDIFKMWESRKYRTARVVEVTLQIEKVVTINLDRVSHAG